MGCMTVVLHGLLGFVRMTLVVQLGFCDALLEHEGETALPASCCMALLGLLDSLYCRDCIPAENWHPG